jgi:hypothetical protein
MHSVIVFISIRSEQTMRAEKPAPIVSLTIPRRSVNSILSEWLLSFPTFHDALQHGETSFQALPYCAKLPILKRTATDMDPLAVTSAILNEVRASYVELSTICVVEAVESYLSAGAHREKLQSVRSTGLEAVAAQFPATTVPLVARQPCLLSPGKGIFLDGWARFIAYWSRNDKTIPLLAVDWPTVYERLSQSRDFLGRSAK